MGPKWSKPIGRWSSRTKIHLMERRGWRSKFEKLPPSEASGYSPAHEHQVQKLRMKRRELARTFQGSPAFSPGSPDHREKSTPHRQIYIRRWRHSIPVMEGSLLIGATDLPSFIYETCPLLSFIAVYSLRYYSLSELLRFISIVIRRTEICLCV